MSRCHRILLAVLTCAALTVSCPRAQDIFGYAGDPIPPEIEEMYTRGIQYLVTTQGDSGGWEGRRGSEPGVVGLALLAILAHGDDPNVGPYSEAVQRAVAFILAQADGDTGYIGSSMYNHGFATLALAEAYGTVNNPKLGPALRKAVDCILTAQARNPAGGWRYSPTSTDADTTVSGAQMVALLAAHNAGIAIPKMAVEKGLTFFKNCRGGDGGFGYTGADSSNGPRAAIGATVFALAKQRESPEFKGAVRYLQQMRADSSYGRHYYYLYYGSQAFFHAGPGRWEKWQRINTKQLQQLQAADGSWSGSEGPTFCTSAALLSMALNYRLLPIYER